MKRSYLKGSMLLIIALSIAMTTHAQQAERRIDSLMQALHSRGQFNGGILISEEGKVIYKKAYGKANLRTDKDFTLSTPCCLASVSKQFTAMAIMMQQEDGKLGIDDPISKYLTGFPAWGQTVTIRHLLNHTSGIINYEQLGIGHPGLTNDEVIQKVSKLTVLRFAPGQKYEYSNTGYILLSAIIEKLSGMTYAEFMDRYIFKPLHMHHTFVFGQQTSGATARAIGYGKFGEISDYTEFTTGDGGIFSTVNDMLKWDKALLAGKLVSRSMLDEAFSPAILSDGTRSPYGFGWMLEDENGERVVFHTGGSGGFRTYNELQPKKRAVIIMLTNNENSPRREIRNAILNILHNKPYRLPRISIGTEMYRIRNRMGIDSAIVFYERNKRNDTGTYDFAEQELNLLGYKLWSDGKMDEAIRIFDLNTVAYPNSSNTWESLGEAYLQQGNRPKAKDNFDKSLSIDPSNTDAIRMLKKMH